MQLPSRNQWHFHGNVLESHLFYWFLLHRNLDQFIFIFSNAYTPSSPPNFYLKLSLFRLQHYHEFLRFFLCGKLYCFRDINVLDRTNFQIQAHHKISISERARDLFILITSTWLIHIDGPCNYLYSFQKQPAPIFIVNINCCFPD